MVWFDIDYDSVTGTIRDRKTGKTIQSPLAGNTQAVGAGATRGPGSRGGGGRGPRSPYSPEVERFLASLAPHSPASTQAARNIVSPESAPSPHFDPRTIVDAMLKPDGNGTVVMKPDGTTTFKILPDHSPASTQGARDVLSGLGDASPGSQYQWGDINATAMQAIADANNAASGNASAFTGAGGDINAMAQGLLDRAGVVDDSPVVEKTPQQHADEYLTMLSKMDTDEDRIQFGLDPMGDGSVAGFLSEEAAAMLRDGQGGLGEPAATSRFAWEGGKIVPKGDGSETETETTETETTETETETETPQVEECGVGEVRNAAGVCVPIAQATPDDACPAGQVRDANGNCVSVYTDPFDAADPEGTIETLSANPREIAKTRLDDTKTAITSMLNSGLLDIKTAQELYDTETERVWKDFLSTQNAVRSDFRNVADAQRAQRYDDRIALEEQMRAAGVNPGLVGDRFAMIDAVAGAGADERGAYLDDLGLVAQMADADRKFMGEGIFGGYKQDLRSRADELGYGAEVDRIGADYDARSQALQAADLAPFLGLDPRAVAAGLASGVDIPGLSTAVSEAALDRALTVSEGSLDRGVSQQRADTEADRLAEQIRQFDVGIDPATGLPYGFDPATGLDAGQTATLTAQGIDPLTGRPYGFDTATGLTAADKLSAQQFADQLESTEGMAADKLDFAQSGLDLDWWKARGDQAAGVIDRQLEKNQFELLEDKFALVEDQFAWDQAMDIAELGDQDFNLGTQLSQAAALMTPEFLAEIGMPNLNPTGMMQEVADYLYNNNMNADNTGYAHALAALGYGPVLTFLYTQRFMEDGTPQEVAEGVAEAAVDALEETGGASTEPVIGAADRAKTGSPPISATERTRVNVGANPPAGVRTVDNDELLRPMENYYQDAEGNYYSEDWKAPEAPDPGSNPRFDTASGIQYVTNNDGLIIRAPDTAAAREAGLVVGQMDPNRTSTARTGIVRDRTSTVPQ